MRLLADQDVYALTVRFLRGLGHDMATAAEGGMSQSADADLLRAEQAEGGCSSPETAISAGWCSCRR